MLGRNSTATPRALCASCTASAAKMPSGPAAERTGVKVQQQWGTAAAASGGGKAPVHTGERRPPRSDLGYTANSPEQNLQG